MKLTYHLKALTARNAIDLEDYAGSIIYSIKKVFPNCWVDVYPDYFTIEGSTEELTQMAKLQNMGRQISFSCSDLRDCVTTYGNSRQLFKIVENKDKKR